MRQINKCFVVITIAALLGIIIFLLQYFFVSNETSVFRAYPWFVKGQVFDSHTNSIEGAKVVAQGTLRVTYLNAIAGTQLKEFHEETFTDKKGGFSLKFQASGFQLDISKTGYSNQTYYLFHDSDVGDSTNQVLKIRLDHQITVGNQ